VKRRGAMAYIKKRTYATGKTVYVVGFKDPSGKWVERVAGRRKRDAENLLRRITEELARGVYGRDPAPTFGEFAKGFLRQKQGEVKPSTYRDYEQVIEDHLLPYLGAKPLDEIKPAHVAGLLLHLQERGVSAATRGKILRVLRVIVRQALALEFIPKDVTAGIRAPRVDRKEPRFLTPDEVNALLAATAGSDIGDIIAVAVLAGLRRGEILGLTWDCVDFGSRVLRVVRSYHPVSGLSDLKSAASRRTVPMSPHLVAILQARKRRLHPPPDGLVFPSREGTVRGRGNFVAREFEPALKAAGIGHIRFHDLRHTFASLAIEGGLDIKTLQVVMGHSSIAVTANTYAHLYHSALERAGRALDAALSGPAKVVPFPSPKREGR
jgi:integrase